VILRRIWPALSAALLGGLVAAVVAQQDMSKVEVRTEKLADGVWVLYGAGGNIGLCSGPDGALFIDDQYAAISSKILAAAKSANDAPVRWVVNTQDRVRQRMIEGQDNKFFQRKVDPAPAKALPILTFNDSTTLHVNGQDVVAFHVAPAHTDGDVIVWFPKANVVHMGDTFFSSTYPIIDLESGGSINGMVAASERVLARIDGATRVIPGHGTVSDKAGLQRYHDMLVGTRAAVAKLVKQKKKVDEVVAAKPTTPWDDAWGNGYMKPALYTTLLYTELAAAKQK